MGDKIVENITDLLLEVIGYLTPITYLILLFSFFLKEKITFNIPSIFDNELLLLIALYGFGYLLRSLSIYLGVKRPFNIQKKIIDELSQKSSYKKAKETLIVENNLDDNITYSEIRNICLGKYPDISNKVYLFMFRSSLFFDLFIINLLFLIGILFDYLFSSSLFEISFESGVLVIIMIILMIPLLKARKRFFEISYKIPISNYLSKNLK